MNLLDRRTLSPRRTALRLVLGAATAACLVGAAARADDVKKESFDLRAPSRWKVGDTVTENESLETTATISVSSGDGPAQSIPGGTQTQESTLVRRCLAVDEAGKPTKMLLYVKAWRVARGGPEDRSLEDAVLELRPDGWTLLTTDLELSPQARQWLTGDLLEPGSSGEDAAAGLLPPGAASVGDTWVPADAASIQHVLRRLGIDPRAKGAATKCALTTAQRTPTGVTARVEYETTAAADTASSADAPSIQVHVTGAVEGAPGAWHRTLATSMTSTFDVSAQKDGRTIVMHADSKMTSAHTPGGEIPSWEPAAPDEDATLCEFGRAAAVVGDIVTEEGSDEFTVTTRREDCSCSPCPTPEETRSTEWTAVRRCDAVAGDGRPSRERVFLKAWKHEAGGAADTSLEGAWFDVTSEGWKLTSDATPSAAARKWIATREPAGADAVLPLAPRTPRPSRVGTKWMPDTMDAARRGLWNEGFALEPAHATGRSRILEAEETAAGVVAKVRFHTETPLNGTVGAGDRLVTALPGSEVKVSGSASGPVASWGRIGSRETLVECDVYVRRDARVGRLATKHDVSLIVQPGGEMPEAPK